MSIRKTFEEKLSLGYTFDKDRELLSMVYICYLLMVTFGLVVLLLHTFEKDLLPVTYRYHSIVALAAILLWFLKQKWVNVARFLLLSYLLLGLFIGNYLMSFSSGSEAIVPIVRANIFYYKLIPAIIFVFVNVVFGFMFSNNYRYAEIMQIQREELIQSEKMASLGTLTAGIAHEINNPMNFISGSLQALEKLKEQYPGNSEEECEKLLKLMDSVMGKAFEGLNRTEDIISKLGAFSNPEKPEKQHILCHEQQMRLVFSHILRNAIDALESKAHKDKEFIEITAAEEKISRHFYSRITFRNSGPAIPEHDMHRIFDPFFSSWDTGEGMGMGMSLSYMMVREHEGKLEVSNEEGAVRFDVLLPLDEESKNGIP